MQVYICVCVCACVYFYLILGISFHGVSCVQDCRGLLWNSFVFVSTSSLQVSLVQASFSVATSAWVSCTIHECTFGLHSCGQLSLGGMSCGGKQSAFSPNSEVNGSRYSRILFTSAKLFWDPGSMLSSNAIALGTSTPLSAQVLKSQPLSQLLIPLLQLPVQPHLLLTTFQCSLHFWYLRILISQFSAQLCISNVFIIFY